MGSVDGGFLVLTAPLPDTALKLRVRNVAGIKQVDLLLNGLVLVCGINGAGKSSLLQCAAAGALATAFVRGQRTRVLASRLLRRGAEAGSVVLAYAGGETKVAYPDAKVEQSGIPRTLGTALGINAAALMDLPAKDRIAEIGARLKADPSKADLTAWLAGRPEPKISAENIGLLFERIEASGWDAVHAAAKEGGTRLKGRWEQVTGDRFGAKKAETWAPPGMSPDRAYDLEAAEAEAEQLRERATALSMKSVAVRTSRVDLEARAGRLGEAQKALAALEAEQEALDREGERLTAERDKMPDATDAAAFPQCPHCLRAIKVSRPVTHGPLVLEKAPPALAGEALERLRAERRVVLDAIEGLGVDIQRNATALVDARIAVDDAAKAQQDLARLTTFTEVSQADIDMAIDEHRQAGRRVDGIKALIQARAIHQEWQINERMVEALAPEGVRATIMQQRMAGFNARLGEVAAAAEFAEVAVSDECEATYDGRPYALLSESEQWRVDLTIAVTLGRMEKAGLILVDRLDVLHAPARRGVLLMLKGLGVPALIGMTAKVVDDAPDLGKARMGARYWLKDGVLEGSA